jgi:hypothetical protein
LPYGGANGGSIELSAARVDTGPGGAGILNRVTDDGFSKVGGHFIEKVVTGGAAALANVEHPGMAILVAAGVSTAFDWFKARREKNDKAWDDARVAAVEDWCRRLDEEVSALREALRAAGKTAPGADVLTTEHVYVDFVQAVVEAKSAEKRLALTKAAAHQFDPTVGDPSARRYWFDRVRQLTDIQVRLLTLLGAHEIIVVAESSGTLFLGKAREGTPSSVSEAIALVLAAGDLTGRNASLLRMERIKLEVPNEGATEIKLEPQGKVLASFLR